MNRVDNWLPSIFTFVNLSLGFISLTLIFNGQIRAALSILILALFFDGIDGRIARKLNVSSIIGKELDSLSDYFSFGIAPAFFFVVNTPQPNAAYHIPAIAFLIFGAYHIAKYNATFLYGSSDDEFPGLPINVAGIIVASISYLGFFPFLLEAIIIIILGYLTITNIPYPSLKNYRPRKIVHLPIPLAVLLVLLAFPLVTFIVFSIYVIYGIANIFIDFDSLFNNLKEFKNHKV